MRSLAAPSERWDRPLVGRALRAGSVTPWGRALLALIVVSWVASLWLGFLRGLGLLTLTCYAAALIGFARPAVGLLGIGVLCTLDAPARIFILTGGLFRWNTLNYILLLVAMLGLPVLLRIRDIHTRLLQVLIALLGAEILISPDVAFGVQHVFHAFSILGLLVYFEVGGVRKETWVWLGLVCGLTGAAGGAAFNLQLAMLPFANPNAFAYFPLGALFVICLAFRFADAQPARQLSLALLAGVNLMWVFLTGSRGSLLVGVLAGLFLIHSTPTLGRRAVVLASLAIVGLGSSAHFTKLQDFAVHRWEVLVDPTRSLASRTSGRSDLALGAWYIFQEHPFGVGTGGFATAWAELGRREGMSGFQEGRRFQAHAGWMKILAENGIPGILLLGAFVFSFAVVGLRQRDRRLRLLGLFTTAVLTTAWISTEFQSKGLWFLAAGTASLLRSPPIDAGVIARPGPARRRPPRAGL